MTPAPPDRAMGTNAVRRGFRDDIQGMRALAVLGILVFHAGIAPYPGGFVTLDVFFVLSGFLITTLLLREVARTGASTSSASTSAGRDGSCRPPPSRSSAPSSRRGCGQPARRA